MQEVEKFIAKHALLSSDQTVAVGVSGGPDSLALLHYLWKRSSSCPLKIIAVSVDHQLRGKESAEELQFVEKFCEDRNIVFEGRTVDVSACQKKTGSSVQVAARECRYSVFKEVMNKHNAQSLALGHHADDQMETILMRLVRGSEGKSLAGIPAKRPFGGGQIIRPFLSITKNEIEHYCKVHHLHPVYDPSNASLKYSRNRYRQKILPFLKEENPAVHVRFQHFSETISEDETYLLKQAEEGLKKAILNKKTEEITLSVPDFLEMPISLQKRGITLILNYLYKQIPSSLSSVHKENFLSLIASGYPGGILHFPMGLRIIRSYEKCRLSFQNEQKENEYAYKVAIPGELMLPAGILKAEYTEVYPEHVRGKDVFVCAANDISFPLTVRTRKPGDRMMLAGMKRSRKIKDIFIDCKVSQSDRDIWPVVEDANGRILWLPGLKHASADHSEQTNQWIILNFRKFFQDV